MSLELVFTIASNAVMPAWLLLAVVPWWRWTQRIAAVIVPVCLAVLYLVLLLLGLRGAEGGFSSLAGVKSLFSSDMLLLAGWVHYLAFDLFIGSWEVRDARRSGVPHLAVIPCLALTLLAGPVGLLLYLGLRAGWCRNPWIDEAAATTG